MHSRDSSNLLSSSIAISHVLDDAGHLWAKIAKDPVQDMHSSGVMRYVMRNRMS